MFQFSYWFIVYLFIISVYFSFILVLEKKLKDLYYYYIIIIIIIIVIITVCY